MAIDEKVLVERLEEQKHYSCSHCMDDAIEIVNQLAEEQKQCIKSSCSNCETYDNEKHYCPKWCDVIENTVKELAEESNLTPCYLGSPCEYQNEDAKMPMEHWDNGWIPCSERLPETNDAVNITWVNRKPEPYYQNIKDKPFTATGHYHKGRWYWYSCVCQDLLDEYGKSCADEMDKDIEVLAWQPLPAPFKPKE